MEKRYPSDLTDKQWEKIHQHYLDQYNKKGRPPSKRLREIWNGIFYITRSGCAWRMLPKGFPPWKTIYNHLAKVRKTGKLDQILKCLREEVREKREK